MAKPQLDPPHPPWAGGAPALSATPCIYAGNFNFCIPEHYMTNIFSELGLSDSGKLAALASALLDAGIR
jgi:hypothetical protein